MLEPVALLSVLSIVSLIRGSTIPSLHHDTAATTLFVFIYAVPDYMWACPCGYLSIAPLRGYVESARLLGSLQELQWFIIDTVH